MSPENQPKPQAGGEEISDLSGQTAQLRLLALTDVHAYLTAFDYGRDRQSSGMGLAALASLVDEAREEAPNSLLFDNGDLIQGGPVGDAFAGDDKHPLIMALNAMGVDGATLGNHEFNYGIEAVLAAYGGAEFDVVCANLRRCDNGAYLIAPTAILERTIRLSEGRNAKCRVGIFGVLPPDVTNWDRRHLEGNLAAGDMVEAAEDAANELKEQGADIVVALCHGGVEPGSKPMAENPAHRIAGIDGVDALIAGHVHRLFPGTNFGVDGANNDEGTLSGTPAVMPGWRGSHLGIIDLDLSYSDERWKVAGHTVSLRSVSKVNPPEHPAILAIAEKPHQIVRERLAIPMGNSPTSLNSFFALLPVCSSATLLAKAVQANVRSRLQQTEHAHLPVLGSGAPFKAGGYGGPENYVDVAAGVLRLRDLREICPYPNAIAALKVDGQFLKAWLERAASVFCQVVPNSSGGELLNPRVATSVFEAVCGLDVVFDLSQPVNKKRGRWASVGRVKEMRYNGALVEADQEFVLATSDYRAGGGGGFSKKGNSTLLVDGPELTIDVLSEFVGQDWEPEPVSWRFAELGSQVIYRTSPSAVDHLDMISAHDPTPLGVDNDGFMQVQVTI